MFLIIKSSPKDGRLCILFLAKSWHLFRKIRKYLTKTQGRKNARTFWKLEDSSPSGEKGNNIYSCLKESKR
jgi:hypothetical protein